MPGAKITALGCYVPPGVLTNQDLEKMVDTSNQWIMERTGIAERHIAAPDIATSDLAVEAAKIALAQRGIEARELDAIIVCTVTPGYVVPLHGLLGAGPAGRERRVGVRPGGCVLRLRLRLDHGRAPGILRLP